MPLIDDGQLESWIRQRKNEIVEKNNEVIRLNGEIERITGDLQRLQREIDVAAGAISAFDWIRRDMPNKSIESVRGNTEPQEESE